MFARFFGLALLFVLVAGSASAQEPTTAATWPPQIARKLPPAGRTLAAEDRTKAEAARDEVRRALEAVPQPTDAGLRADVAVYHKALDYALRHGEFFDAKSDARLVEALRKQGVERATALKDGKSPWTEQRGVVVRGFFSQLDDSPQPYGLVVPEGLDLSKPVPLYVWLHGRGDTACDLQFMARMATATKPVGPLLPPDAIVLHPFGRYCNGYKSAGEPDIFEAIADVKRKYKIDGERIVLAGFSMGGAGAWHLGAHFADRWCAVHAGAGFVDVRRYQNVTPDKLPPSYEQKLWGHYDVPDYRRNLLNVPVLAYSGEVDKQKQAADIMEAELAAEGYRIPHLIGPKMGHKYDPESLVEIHKRLAALVQKGRDPYPKKVVLQTKTLRYNRMFWVEATGLSQHWEDARLDAEIIGPTALSVTTKNVTAFRLIEPWGPTTKFSAEVKLTIDGVPTAIRAEAASNVLYVVRRGETWSASTAPSVENGSASALRKTPGLQGPIDDAFVNRFAVVRPSASSAPSLVDRWAEFESAHFIDRWRALMRGEPIVAAAANEKENEILWGTPQTNPRIRALLDRLPIRWDEKAVALGDLKFDARTVVPVLIFPHPERPGRYVVLNSGLTFREGDDRTNSLQNPKLGDWAFIDVTQPPSDATPGRVLAAGFFDEQWRLQGADK